MDEFVMVAVPPDRVLDVYALLAAEANGGSPLPAKSAAGESASTWTPDLLKDQFARSPKSLKALQKHLATNPGGEFTTDELARVMDVAHGWQSVAGALGAYGRRIKNHYGLPWPFSYHYSEDRERYVYSMDSANAEVIAAL